MHWAVAMIADQTWVYLMNEPTWTTVHGEAHLFESLEAACLARDAYEDSWIEEVPDPAEFHSRPDTW